MYQPDYIPLKRLRTPPEDRRLHGVYLYHSTLENHIRPPPLAARKPATPDHPIFRQSYAIGDPVFLDGTHQPHTFLGLHKVDGIEGVEYEAELRAPTDPADPPQSIRLLLSHQMRHRDRIQADSSPEFLSWDWFKEKLRKIFGM
jgi:hypothetical protein